MISKETIDRIIETTKIVDVIGDFVSLKRKGANHLGLCPFHNEKTPSFTVSEAKGIYKCFGCGKAGNAINFIMEYEHMSYVEALKYLASKYGIPIEERELSDEEKNLINERESLIIVNEFAANQFVDVLFHHDEGKTIGMSYFKERGFTEKIIKEFKLGFSPSERNYLTKLAVSKGYKLDKLEKLGLTVVKSSTESIDRFAGRVMFPIFNLTGKVIGFGGRTLSSDKSVAKYLNSPESIVYNKSKVLYGLFHAKQEIIKLEKCYLVEGYTDVLSLHQCGIKNVVASSGTSLTEEQIRLIHRFSENVTILYDGDFAGIKASLRGIDMLLSEGLNVRVVLFPDGEDPDSFAKKHGAAETLKFINENEVDFIEFKISILKEDAKNDPVKKSNLIKEIVKSIAVIDDDIKRTVYIKECEMRLNIDESVIYSEVAKNRSKIINDQNKLQQIKERTIAAKIPKLPSYAPGITYEEQENLIIRILLLYGNEIVTFRTDNNEKIDVKVADYIIYELKNDELELKNVVHEKIFKIVDEINQKGEEIQVSYFVNHPDPEISKTAINVITDKYKISKIWERFNSTPVYEEKNLVEILLSLFIIYKLKILRELQQKLQSELKTAIENHDAEKKSELLVKINETVKLINELAKHGNIVIL